MLSYLLILNNLYFILINQSVIFYINVLLQPQFLLLNLHDLHVQTCCMCVLSQFTNARKFLVNIYIPNVLASSLKSALFYMHARERKSFP